MTLAIFGTMLSYMTVSSFTPGPGNLLALNNTTQYGFSKSKKLLLGICCGYCCVQILCTVAVYCLNSYISPVLSVLKYIGAAYVCWMAMRMMLSKPATEETTKTPTFLAGFFLQLVNVKIYFYIISLLTTYLIPNIASLPLLLLAGAGVVAVGCSATFLWAFCGTKLQTFYRRYFRWINLVLGAFLLYCAWSIIRS